VGAIVSSENVQESLLDAFIFETSHLLEQLEVSILSNEKEKSYSDTAINEIFRIMHTIKGSSAMMMYESISKLSHAMEDLFYYLRDQKPLEVNYSILTDLILGCIDFIKVEIQKIKNGDAPDGEFITLNNEIMEFLSELKLFNSQEFTAVTNVVVESNNQYYIPAEAENFNINKNYYRVLLYFDEECEMENIRAFSVVFNLQDITKDIFFLPEDILKCDKGAEIIRKDGFLLYFITEKSYEEMTIFLQQTTFLKSFQLTQMDNDCELIKLFSQPECDKLVNTCKEKNLTEVSQENRGIQMNSSQQSIISVSVTKLDKLMDLVGEMVIAEAMVVENSDLRGLVINNFFKAARQLSKITTEIQDMVMSIRMVPLSATFHKMHRIVRDMQQKLGKDINLVLIGEETEVDKNIIEHIADPLMHLVRNSLDHGIEVPQERLEKGKIKTGTIILEAKNSGGDVLIIVRDDGKGLDKEAILEKAMRNGLLKKPKEEMLDKEVFNLIFLPGFSTKENVSEFSGRGVGMDVVTKNIESVGGSISLESTYGRGTVITIKIPLTLAIIDGMTIKVGNSHYTIPTISIKEFFRPNEKDVIRDTNEHEMIMVRGQCYPIIRLHKLYNVNNARSSFENGIIIMVSHENKTTCVFADELLGQQQVVVKALPDYISRTKKINGITGCTLLGDANISLIIDVAGLTNTR
jgi:two-component system chemotaxis sensor kinase CheA